MILHPIYTPTWAEIDLDKFRKNIKNLQKSLSQTGNPTLIAVLKADGYGCGASVLARAAVGEGVTRFAVARVDEAVELRKAGISAPILVLGYSPQEAITDIISHQITPTVFDEDFAQKLDAQASKLKKVVKVHVKIDTGMHRLGVQPEQALAFIKNLGAFRNVEVEGIFSHFSSSDEADRNYTEWQRERFEQVIHILEKEKISIPLIHCANSAAILGHPATHYNAVRAGTLLYGLDPSDEVPNKSLALQPILSFKTTVAHVKRVLAGAKVSYSRTYTTPEETTIATLPVGYADGYSRLLSSKGEVLINGKRYPVVGRVCMDMSMVNIGNDKDIKTGDEVVLFGTQGRERIRVEDVAAKIGTINVDVMCEIGKRVPRVYLEGGKVVEVRKLVG